MNLGKLFSEKLYYLNKYILQPLLFSCIINLAYLYVYNERENSTIMWRDIMNINNNLLNEKINQLKKGLEIVGANESLYNKTNDEIISNILDMVFKGESLNFNINDSQYTINELIQFKQEYEKHFLKNKLKTLNAIVYKIKKYDTSLDSLIRKYKKTRVLEEYNKIYASINKTYRLDINKLVLSSVLNIENITDLDEQEHFYGDYLNQKRKQIIDGVVSKVGIV